MKIQTDTDMVEIKAVSRFLPDQSDLPASRYVFAYHITINNRSEQTVKLLTRHWIITDAEDKVQEVRGEGVIGQQPELPPGRILRGHQRLEHRHAGRHHEGRLH